MVGVGLTYLMTIALQPGEGDASVGEEIVPRADGLFVSQQEGFTLREQGVQHVGMLLVVAVTGAEVEVVGGEVVHVVVPQEEHDLVGVGDIEIEDVHEFVDGGLSINAFLRIGVDIVAEEHDLVVFFDVLLGISPELATVDIGDNQYFPVHRDGWETKYGAPLRREAGDVVALFLVVELLCAAVALNLLEGGELAGEDVVDGTLAGDVLNLSAREVEV